MSKRPYSGKPLDATEQSVSEAPYWNDGEMVDVIDDDVDAEGVEHTENVPMLGERPDTEGQTTFEDWRRSP